MPTRKPKPATPPPARSQRPAVATAANNKNEPKLPFDDKQTLDMTTSAELTRKTVAYRVNTPWYSQSRQVDKSAKEDMAEAADTDEGSFSASKRLLACKHPAIEKAKELKRRVEGYWRGVSLPSPAFLNPRKPEPGVRLLVLNGDDPGRSVRDFEAQMATFQGEAKVVEREVNEAMGEIKVMEQQRLKGLFRAEDYAAVTLDVLFAPVSIQVPAMLAKIAPEVAARYEQQIEQYAQDAAELAAATLLNDFHQLLASWTKSLGPVTRIYPPVEHPLHHLSGAEIRERLPAGPYRVRVSYSKDKATVEEGVIGDGRIMLLVRYYPKEADGTKSKHLHERLAGPLTEKEYTDLRPSQVASERRTFQDTTVTAMTDFLGNFRNVSGALRLSGTFTEAITRVEQQLARCKDANAAAKELRTSETFRADTHKLVADLNRVIGEQVELIQTGRRMVDRGASKRQTESP